MSQVIKTFVRWLLIKLYRVEVQGQAHLKNLDERVMVVANHTSFLDVVLLWAFLPTGLMFAANTKVTNAWYIRPVNRLAEMFPLDPLNPLSLRALVRRLKKGGMVVIFPEGRITVTGALMKIYNGPGLVALKANAQVLPIAIEGAQYTPFSRLGGKVRRRWFPKVTLTVFPPRYIQVPGEVAGRDQREYAGNILADIMTEMVFSAGPYKTTLFQRLLDARKIHGGKHQVVEDIERQPLSYNDLILRTLILGDLLRKHTQASEYVGVLLPNMVSAVVTFWALQAYGRVPAMLNYTVGAAGMCSAVKVGGLKTIVTARRFIDKADLADVIKALPDELHILYLEDIAQTVSRKHKLKAYLIHRSDSLIKQQTKARVEADSAAVVLFTSGTEGVPKGVVLSHSNVLANLQQVSSRFDFSAQDVVLATLPLFHSFGLTGCCILPLLNGMKSFYYPTPLHYRVIPEVAYEINATVLFGTNTFLDGYGRAAHPYDFYSVRYVFAGAEKLRDETKKLWQTKFGLRLFEGYGATECSPAVTGNTPMGYRPGTVGRLLPGMEYQLEPVAGLDQGGRLHVCGPNIMKGYLLHDRPGELVPPQSKMGEGWCDMGDIVTVDDERYVTIRGRAKRFAKIGGEMVSLVAVEELAALTWPEAMHVAIAFPDERKGEKIILLTTQTDATKKALLAQARQQGIGEINVPRQVMLSKSIPLMGSGKVDLRAVQLQIEAQL